MTVQAFPGLPRGREARIAYFEARIAARDNADPLYPYKQLFKLASPLLVKSMRVNQTFVNGRITGLSEHHELMRRCYVLRAWCAQKIGWRNELRDSLYQAGVHRRLARSSRKEGR